MKHKIFSLFYDNKKFAECLKETREKKELWVPSCGKACPTTSNLTPHSLRYSPTPLPHRYVSCVLLFCVIWHWSPFFHEAFFISSLWVSEVIFSLYLPLSIFPTFQGSLFYHHSIILKITSFLISHYYYFILVLGSFCNFPLSLRDNSTYFSPDNCGLTLRLSL